MKSVAATVLGLLVLGLPAGPVLGEDRDAEKTGHPGPAKEGGKGTHGEPDGTAADGEEAEKPSKRDGDEARPDKRTAGKDPVTEGFKAMLGVERPTGTDLLLLRNGDKLTGTILNEGFSLRTSYARIRFGTEIVAGLDLEGGPHHIETIITVNRNRFSGFIDEPVIKFRLQTGPEIQVRREKVLKAAFQRREAEMKGIAQRQFVRLKTGDFFTGKVLNENFVLTTSYAKVPVALSDAESVRLVGQGTPATKVILRNGDILQGVLQTEDLEIELDVGPKVKIYQDRIDALFCREGFVPEMGEEGVRSTWVKVSQADLSYSGAVVTQGVLINSVVDGSALGQHLQAGDIIAAADGRNLGGNDGRGVAALAKAFQDLMKGRQEKVLLKVIRDEDLFHLTLVRTEEGDKDPAGRTRKRNWEEEGGRE